MHHPTARAAMLPTDDDLMRRLEAGDVEASLGELQRRHGAAVHRYVLTMLRDDHLAQDVVQETFAKVFFKSHLYQPLGHFRAWLFEVARNQALSAIRWRRRSPLPFSSMSAASGEGDGERARRPETALGALDHPVLEERELMAAFHRAVAELPDRYRQSFTLCVLQGMQYQEAARELGVPTGTVAIRILRARQRLFGALSRHFERLRRPPACLQR
jgi:RNA polymerase sigma-70 factor (ECF subfamily)